MFRRERIAMTIEDEQVTASSGNVFRDLGRPDADLLLFKAHLTAHIATVIERRGWTQIEAAAHLNVDQPRISHLVRGRLAEFSVDALLGYLKRLDVKMNISIADPVGDSNEKLVLAV